MACRLSESLVLLGHTSIRVTEKHYSPWVRERQEQAEADIRRTWTKDPVVLLETKGYATGTRNDGTCETKRKQNTKNGGGGGIRTHETLSGLTVFKTAGVNRFPTLLRVRLVAPS